MQIEKIFIASDHAGFDAKQIAKKTLNQMNFEVMDLGTNDLQKSVDYPDFAYALSKEIAKDEKNYGILICGTGIGISIAANRNPKIRCALCHDVLTAKLAREHNDANVLAFGGRILGSAEIESIIKIFFNTEFLGGRHARRIAKLGEIKWISCGALQDYF